MESSREIRGLMLAVYHDWAKGELSWADFVLDDPDVVLIGTDPMEWWRGGGTVQRVMDKQTEEMGLTGITPGDLHCFEVGDMAWVIDDPTFSFRNGVNAKLRSTVVMVRTSAGWKMAHWHVSGGVANEDLLNLSLTINMEEMAQSVEAEKPKLADVDAAGMVTIVFTDIENSTAMNEQLGDDLWLPVIRKHSLFVEGLVAGNRGRVVKNQGDGHMLAFTNLDDAVRCTVQLQRVLASQPADPVHIRMRMGLHCGHPVSEENDFFGRDVAYAARIASCAVGGEILVSERVHKILESSDEWRFVSREALSLKGFDGLHEMFSVSPA